MENLETLHCPAVFPTYDYFKGRCDGSYTAETDTDLLRELSRMYCVKTEIIA